MSGRARPGTVSDRYVLGEVLGLGGAATVYRAWDGHTHRTVAVKLYRAGIADTDRPPHRAEVTALAQLRHPGLVALYDAGLDAGRAYIAMQMIEGETLAQRIRNGPLTTTAVTAMGATLADTLAYVHERGVIHRDVKPANVLLDGHDRPFLTDFGVARLLDATRTTATGSVLGTPAFLAPEQVRGQPVGPAADIYALGLVLLEALTGQREYPGGAVESAVARLHRPPQLPAQLPTHLHTLLEAMTASDAAARPDAAEVASRLGMARPTQLTAGRYMDIGTRESRSRRRVLGSLIALTATAALGTVLLIEPPSTASAPSQKSRTALPLQPQLQPPPESSAPPIAFPPPITDGDQPVDPPVAQPLATDGPIPPPNVENRSRQAPPPRADQTAAAARLSIDRESSADDSSSVDANDTSSGNNHKKNKNKNKNKNKGKGKGKGK